jgi:hypothetical protein
MDFRTVVDYQDEIAKTVQEITFDEDDELRPTCELVLLPCVGKGIPHVQIGSHPQMLVMPSDKSASLLSWQLKSKSKQNHHAL